MPAPASPVFSGIQAAFTRMNWQSRRVEDREILEADFEVHHTKVRIHVQAFPELNALSVVATASHQVPDSRMGIIGEMLMRTNLELTIGAFEMNYDDGSVLFRATNLGQPLVGTTGSGAGTTHPALTNVAGITLTNSTNAILTFNGQTGLKDTSTKGILPWALVDCDANGGGTS